MKTESIHGKKTVLGDEGLPQIDISMVSLREYSIQKEIGRGGMAVVYEAVEKSLNRLVALKVLSKELSKDTSLLQRFVYEAQAAARLSHPNIVQIYSIGQESGIYYFAMEYIRGRSVEDMVTGSKRIPMLEAINIIRQTVLALREAYKAGIIHRDVKPGNILVSNEGLVKVADFGLAAEVKGARVATGGRIVGTPLYMSPEQAQGKEGDHRSDMYSLGITFYQMITGKPPFSSTETKELIKSQINTNIPSVPAGVHPFVAKLITRLTNKDPAKRYPDYDTLLNELDWGYRNYLTRRRRRIILGGMLLLVMGVYVYNFFNPLVPEPLPTKKIDKGQLAEDAYKRVAGFVKQNPAASLEASKRYMWIINKYPGTEAAARAEQKLEIVGFARGGKGKEELKKLNAQRKNMIAQGKYQEVIEKYLELKYRYRDTETETLAQGYISMILETARRDFDARAQEAVDYLEQGEYDQARRVYQQLTEDFAVPELVTRARRKLAEIDRIERESGLKIKANEVFVAIKEKTESLVAEHKYREARMYLDSINEREQNEVLDLLVKKQLAEVNRLQREHSDQQVNVLYQERIYEQLAAEVEELVQQFSFEEAMAVIEQKQTGITDDKVLSKLGRLSERIAYLQRLKSVVISGINEELAQKNMGQGILADRERLLIIVKGGFVGLPWKECSPRKIYDLGQQYVQAENAEDRLALAVFCLTYGLGDEAEGELRQVLELAPEKKAIVEKYRRMLKR